MDPSPTPERARSRVAWRVTAHAAALLVAWPTLIAVSATKMIVSVPLFAGIGTREAFGGVVVTTLEMWREIMVVAAIGLGALALVARITPSRVHRPVAISFVAGFLDVLLIATALLLGISLEHPAVLTHPALYPLHGLTVALAQGALLASSALLVGLVAVLTGGRRNTAPACAAAVALVGSGFLAARAPALISERRPAAEDARVILGLDSLAQRNPVSMLRDFTRQVGGAWYELPVTPGLLTNSVWTSILTSRRPSETGIFFVYQAPDWRLFPDNLVARANASGLRTVSFFSDQFTTHVGTDLPFQLDRSGPRGWMQVTTSAVKDASVLLPVVLPLLPRIPGARTPANQAGTFAFDLDRELDDILQAGHVEGGSLVVAHLDYLHQPRYPSFSHLTPAERARVRAARVSAIVDQSLNWQYPRTPGEPLDVYRWKLGHLQRTLTKALVETGFLDPVRRNRLVVFSDHGPRIGVTNSGFGDERYYRTLLFTFGAPERDTRAPISLVDIATLIGLPHPSRGAPAEPVVEYTNAADGHEWARLIATARPLPNGGVRLDRDGLARLGARLLAFHPLAGTLAYVPVPVEPAIEVTNPGEAASEEARISARDP